MRCIRNVPSVMELTIITLMLKKSVCIVWDEIDCIAVEGKFGNCKRKGTLGRVMAKLDDTSESVIHVAIAVLNLNKWLAELLLRLFMSWKGLGCFLSRQILSNLNRSSA